MRVQGKLHWLHCAVTTTLSWLKCHAKRGTVAFDAPGLLAGVRGTLVHDGLAGYRQFECAHSRCNAHPLRELVFVHAQEQEKIRDGWARERMELLVPARQEVAHAGGPLPPCNARPGLTGSGSGCSSVARPSTGRGCLAARPGEPRADTSKAARSICSSACLFSAAMSGVS